MENYESLSGEIDLRTFIVFLLDPSLRFIFAIDLCDPSLRSISAIHLCDPSLPSISVIHLHRSTSNGDKVDKVPPSTPRVVRFWQMSVDFLYWRMDLTQKDRGFLLSLDQARDCRGQGPSADEASSSYESQRRTRPIRPVCPHAWWNVLWLACLHSSLICWKSQIFMDFHEVRKAIWGADWLTDGWIDPLIEMRGSTWQDIVSLLRHDISIFFVFDISVIDGQTDGLMNGQTILFRDARMHLKITWEN